MSKTESLRYLAPLLTIFLFFGCFHITREQIMEKGLERASIFEEISEKNTQIPGGYVELLIKASIKIPQKEFYFFNKRPPRKENSEYPFVLNINGQGVLWVVNCTFDDQRIYVRNKRNPEGGEGLMCRLEKRIRLTSGYYKVYLGLPEEEFETEVTISLVSGSSNVLEFKPIYWRSGDNRRMFWKGISNFDICFNGKPYLSHATHGGGCWELQAQSNTMLAFYQQLSRTRAVLESTFMIVNQDIVSHFLLSIISLRTSSTTSLPLKVFLQPSRCSYISRE